MKALKLQNLRKVYDNGFEALKGIDLEVEAGDFFALLGPNGAGKSTTIGIVTSLVTKTAGKVEICGHDLDREPDAAKRCLGLVPQEINFNQFEKVGRIVLNQAGYYGVPRRQARRRMEEVLKKLDLWDRRDEVSRRLSGGMKRRLMIARALVHCPRVLILDEPTAGVDIEIRYSMWEFLRRLNQEGTTIILTTHYLEEAERLCRHVAIIDHGRIVESTSMKRLLAQLEYHRYLLELRNPPQAIPEIPGYRIEAMEANVWAVEVPRSQGLNPLFAALNRLGLEVIDIRPTSNRLEQLFFQRVRQRAGEAA
ncbi:ABC-2 type transport system ATP-binding protein [Methylomarinovum caldicuralii]|uniref:ABC-2 type transport system ATP-binding protein n=1 Tax=Methylomarinovum caldicuralii TaxID=438856 RepID=A0AAU9C785_9GAMM|nr:ABC transporter ATP-binding protein [Methylomarinovum caldicuralii]BCX81884.1 ABC-2 type transport system ATP-binding protein [Methylomarinovum caldicuralii]